MSWGPQNFWKKVQSPVSLPISTPTPPKKPVVYTVTVSIAREEPLAASAGGSHQKATTVGNDHLPPLGVLAGPTSSEWSSTHLSSREVPLVLTTVLATLTTSICRMLKKPIHMIQQSLFWVYTQRKWNQYLEVSHVHCSIIHNSQDMKPN